MLAFVLICLLAQNVLGGAPAGTPAPAPKASAPAPALKPPPAEVKAPVAKAPAKAPSKNSDSSGRLSIFDLGDDDDKAPAAKVSVAERKQLN